jgi:DNA ligase (NAD+)
MTLSNDIKEKIKLLERWDDAYYNHDTSVVSDEKYDLVKDYVYRKLPPDSPELKVLLQKVGHKTSSGWKKESHTIAMGSQNKVSNTDAIRDWWKAILKDIDEKEPKAVLQHKLDGFSLELKYQSGRLVSAVTRGDGSIGENITGNAIRFRDIPRILPINVDVVVRGEGYITKDDYDTIQDITAQRYKNARNAASGISRRYDGQFSEFVRVIAYDVNAKVSTETEKIEVLIKLGFNAVTTYDCTNLDDILKIYQEYKDSARDLLSYDIDGLVLKLDSLSSQELLGELGNRPNGQVALKFSSDQAITTLEKISSQVGRTGKVTPIGILEPVELMGSTVSKATLHNFAWIEANFISPGAEVVVEKKGDIIPQVVDIITPGKGYGRLDACPACGGSLEWDSVNLWCRNNGCRGRETARIGYWMKTLDMKGYSDSFVQKLWDTGKVRNVGDLYRLTSDDLAAIGGLGAKTIKGFLQALKDTSTMYLEQFIVALGIPTVSTSTAQFLVDTFKSWDRIISLRADELQMMPGFAKVSAQNTIQGIREISDMAEELLKVITIKEKKKGTLSGLSFCVTGSLNSMSRKEFEAFVVDHGGTFKSSVAAGLNYLVTNTPDSGSGKNAKVAKINSKLSEDSSGEEIQIITEKEFLDLAGDNPTNVESDPEDDGPVLEFHPLF